MRQQAALISVATTPPLQESSERTQAYEPLIAVLRGLCLASALAGAPMKMQLLNLKLNWPDPHPETRPGACRPFWGTPIEEVEGTHQCPVAPRGVPRWLQKERPAWS